MADVTPIIGADIVEVWRDIPAFEGFYQASDQGRIRSVDRIGRQNRQLRGRLMTQNIGPWGYPKVTLTKGNQYSQGKVHRLVAAAFLGASKLEVNHINGVKTDNRLSNLEYVTGAQNMRHSREVLGNYHGAPKKPVVGVKGDGTTIRFPSTRAATLAGFHGSHISRCCRGKLRQHRGYQWSYANS